MSETDGVAVPGAEVSPQWARWRASLPIEVYEARFAASDPSDRSVHGEADFIVRYGPRRVLDAGCGTGRVAIELARLGVDVVGADLDPDMLAAATAKAPHIPWVLADLAVVGTDAPGGAGGHRALGEAFDIVAMPGNVMLFCVPHARPSIVASLGALVREGGRLIAGFSLGRGLSVEEYDDYCSRAGLTAEAHFAGWDGSPFGPPGSADQDYVVAVHCRR